ncbi:hypothetical protein SUNI508_07110 [Seiridium unicorne]|uniref:Ankyrin n=1 Tax=Seiridium unicorne TaxID=138068 RepID=A0ABR2UZ39_9PEZI
MALLTGLPDELLLNIGQCCDGLFELHSLSLTCRKFNCIFTQVLDTRVLRKHSYLLTWACETAQVDLVAGLLAAGANPNIPFAPDASRGWERWCQNADTPPSFDTAQRIAIRDVVYGYELFIPPRMPSLASSLPQSSQGRLNLGTDDDCSDRSRDDHASDSSLDSEELSYEVHLSRNLFLTARQISNGDGNVMVLDPAYTKNWVRIRAKYYWFPLHAAVKAGSLKIVELLIQHGAILDPPSYQFCGCVTSRPDPNGYSTPGWTPLHTVFCCKNGAVADFLLSKGSSPYVDTQGTTTVLHTAATFGFITTLRECLIQYPDMDLNKCDDHGKRPLQLAYYGTRDTATMQCLVEHGADPNTTLDGSSFTVLHAACLLGWFQLATVYLEAGAQCNPLWSYRPWVFCRGRVIRPLDLCCTRSTKPAIRNCGLSDEYCDDAAEEEDEWLQSKGGNPFDDQDHLLEYADFGSDTDRTQIVSLLIKKGGRIETLAGRMPSEHDTKFPSPIVLASKAHLVPILKLLLKAGANACERDDFGDFPLSAAVRSLSGSLPLGDCNPAETVELLLDHGADANQKDGDGQNALFQLCALPEAQTSEQVKIQLEVLKLLIDRGATTDAKPFTSSSDFWLSSCNASPLHAAFKQGNLEVCDMLIQHGVSFPVAVAEMQEFFDSIVWTGTSKLGESCISVNGRPEETGWNSRTKRERVLLEQSWLCAKLSYLLCHGDKEAFIRHPRSLWLAGQISDTPLAEMLIRAGASDASWTEHDECCESTLASPQALSVRAIWTEEDCDNFALAIQMMSVPLAQSRTLAYKLLVAACRSLTQPRIVQCLIREGADINFVPPGAQHIIRYLLDRFDVQLFEHIDGSWVEPRILIDTLQVFIESGAKYQFERFGHNSFYNLLGRHMSYGKSGDSSCTDDKEKEHRERLCQKLQERCILKYRHPADITELTIRDAVEDEIDAFQDDSHDGSNDLGPDYSTDDATPMVEIMDQILDRARSLRS